jgi:hypothetical protein
MPAKALQYCAPSTYASAWGYYLFAPFEFWLQSDGHRNIQWSANGHEWKTLTEIWGGDIGTAWDTIAPDDCKGYCPPSLSVSEETTIIQIGLGIIAITQPGWGLEVRPMVNDPAPSRGYVTYEGFIDTDRWHHPLFVNIHLTRTDEPIRFAHDWPLVQVRPMPWWLYRQSRTCQISTDVPDTVWEMFRTDIIDNVMSPNYRRGHYAATSRRAAK